MNRLCAAFGFAATLAVTGLLVSASAQNIQANREQGAGRQVAKIPVSAVKAGDYPIPSGQGPSWLKHLGLAVSQTRMGQVGGTGAPFPATQLELGHSTLPVNVSFQPGTGWGNPE
jgi:hypothetical protein